MHFSASTFMVPYLHQSLWFYLGQICVIFGAYNSVVQKMQHFKNYAGIAPFNSAIWDEVSSQTQHQSIKRHHNECPICTFLVQIRCRYNAHFSWVYSFTKLIYLYLILILMLFFSPTQVYIKNIMYC